MRNHRSCLIVDGITLADDAEYRERVLRLEESLNGDNIKVDVHTAFPPLNPTTGIVKGIVTDGSTSGDLSVLDLVKWGQEQGYVQTILALPTGPDYDWTD